MKYLFLAIFVLLAAQPVQVSSCDMHDSQKTSQHGSHDMTHDDAQSMDCCDQDPSAPSDSCGSTSHCGVCTAGVLAFGSFSIDTIFKLNSRLFLSDDGGPLSRFNPPPFKPPIA